MPEFWVRSLRRRVWTDGLLSAACRVPGAGHGRQPEITIFCLLPFVDEKSALLRVSLRVSACTLGRPGWTVFAYEIRPSEDRLTWATLTGFEPVLPP